MSTATVTRASLGYLTAAEASEVVGMGSYAIVQLCKSGVLPSSQPGKAYLIAQHDLVAYIESHRVTGEVTA
ncbi:hypothetical protein NOCA2770004 [metagenome]|uniref:Helix-turn-helix domain-containing protein n=1 Tax=metagenome TaxID=256318 RepID=A0A2P2CEM8_9ZZZZ